MCYLFYPFANANASDAGRRRTSIFTKLTPNQTTCSPALVSGVRTSIYSICLRRTQHM